MPALELRIYRTLEELENLRPFWDQLLSHYPPATTFCTWEWLSCWWKSFGAERRLSVVAGFNSGALVALAPLAIARERVGWLPLRVLRLMGDGSGDSDNLDCPVQPGFEDVFADCLLRLLRQSKREWDICVLDTLPQDSLLGNRLSQRVDFPSTWKLFEDSINAYAIALPETWDQYLQMLSSEDRKNLPRYGRRLEARYTTRIYRCGEAGQLAGCLDALFRLHQMRWQGAGQPGSFSSLSRREFYQDLSPLLLARNELQLWALELNGEIAAVQFAFSHRDKVFLLQEGYDCHRSSDRLGYVLRGEMIKSLISTGFRTYDFLGGNDPYKARWRASKRQYRRLSFARSGSIGGICLRARYAGGRTKETLRRTMPDSIWNFLKACTGAIHNKDAAS